LVVITGGEPFRQNLDPLCGLLLSLDYDVQIETNGTLSPGYDFVAKYWGKVLIVCSPKTPKLAQGATGMITHLKYILDADHIDENDGLPTSSLYVGGEDAVPCRPWIGYYGRIYVQPMDEQDPGENIRNRDAALRVCMKYGYTLSLQLHKILGLP
jgi:7-carboxy-7-deazaguanine synthase